MCLNFTDFWSKLTLALAEPPYADYATKEQHASVLTPEVAGIRDKDGCVIPRGGHQSALAHFHSLLPIQSVHSSNAAAVHREQYCDTLP